MYHFMALLVSIKHVKYDYVRSFLGVQIHSQLFLSQGLKIFFVLRAFDCIAQSSSAIKCL